MPPPSFGDYRLPRGNHGLSPAQVAENQRWRLLGAASEILAERRLTGLTSRLIARRAGVSSHTFYEHFDDVDALLTAAFANAAHLLTELMAATCSGLNGAQEQRKRALTGAFALGAEEPGLVALMRLEVAVAIPEVGAERERMVARLDALSGGHGKRVYGRSKVAGALAFAVDRLDNGPPGEGAMLSRELSMLLD